MHRADDDTAAPQTPAPAPETAAQQAALAVDASPDNAPTALAAAEGLLRPTSPKAVLGRGQPVLSSNADIQAWLAAHLAAFAPLRIDSRQVQPGDAFLAVPGARSDGRQWLAQAAERGAAAVLVHIDDEDEISSIFNGLPQDFSTPTAAVVGLRVRLGPIASAWFDHPSQHLRVLAVTGTNGKTSSAWWLAQSLEILSNADDAQNPSENKNLNKNNAAIIGTLGVGTPDFDAHDSADALASLDTTGLTTPDAPALQLALHRLRQRGISSCAIEASSIGIVEGRLDGTHIDTAIFTNCTQDHLDYHGTMDAYWAAKRRLFDWPGLRRVLINIDDPHGAELAAQLREHNEAAVQPLEIWTLAILDPQSPAFDPGRYRDFDDLPRLFVHHLRSGEHGLAFTISERRDTGRITPELRALIQTLPRQAARAHLVAALDNHHVATQLLGTFNLSNLLGVIASLRGAGQSLTRAIAAAEHLRPVPGRMQQVHIPDAAPGTQPLIVVDYAHTPDALAQTLLALLPTAGERGGQLWCVFGCGGNRDASKRPLMAAAAQRLAQRLILTSDNPRDEDPLTILAQMQAGLDANHPTVAEIEPDRQRAIERAITTAQPCDVILIAGKGHEDYQEIRGQRQPFSDTAHARAALTQRQAPTSEAATSVAPTDAPADAIEQPTSAQIDFSTSRPQKGKTLEFPEDASEIATDTATFDVDADISEADNAEVPAEASNAQTQADAELQPPASTQPTSEDASDIAADIETFDVDADISEADKAEVPAEIPEVEVQADLDVELQTPTAPLPLETFTAEAAQISAALTAFEQEAQASAKAPAEIPVQTQAEVEPTSEPTQTAEEAGIAEPEKSEAQNAETELQAQADNATVREDAGQIEAEASAPADATEQPTSAQIDFSTSRPQKGEMLEIPEDASEIATDTATFDVDADISAPQLPLHMVASFTPEQAGPDEQPSAPVAPHPIALASLVASAAPPSAVSPDVAQLVAVPSSADAATAAVVSALAQGLDAATLTQALLLAASQPQVLWSAQAQGELRGQEGGADGEEEGEQAGVEDGAKNGGASAVERQVGGQPLAHAASSPSAWVAQAVPSAGDAVVQQLAHVSAAPTSGVMAGVTAEPAVAAQSVQVDLAALASAAAAATAAAIPGPDDADQAPEAAPAVDPAAAARAQAMAAYPHSLQRAWRWIEADVPQAVLREQPEREGAALHASELAAQASGLWVQPAAAPVRWTRVITDSRQAQAGDLFVALQGERMDGHDFLPQVRDAGASAAVVGTGRSIAGLPSIEVPDTTVALGALARGWREQFTPALIAVTGSNGKTTVTQMLRSILAAHVGEAAMWATQGNFNNAIGVPWTLFGLNESHRMAVVELGMNHPGEIAPLARMARPLVALVNNAQREHQEFMHTVEAVAEENASVFQHLEPEVGVAVFPADDAFTALWSERARGHRVVTFGKNPSLHNNLQSTLPDVFARSCVWDRLAWRVRIATPQGDLECLLHIAGEHNVRNALAATACAWAAGVPLEAIARGLSAFEPVTGRSRLMALHWQKPLQNKGFNDGLDANASPLITLVDDTYNANPDSVAAAIDVLAALAAPRLLVLGDMAEVGENGPAFHAEAGHLARERGINTLMTLGAASAATCAAFGPGALHFDDMDALIAAVRAHVREHMGAAAAFGAQNLGSVLVKGSRSMRMERLVAALQADFPPPVVSPPVPLAE